MKLYLMLLAAIEFPVGVHPAEIPIIVMYIQNSTLSAFSRPSIELGR